MEQNQNFNEQGLNLDDYVKLLQEISRTIQIKYPKAIHSQTNGIVEIKNLSQMEQLNETEEFDPSKMSKGRGGNNVAQNMKKSVKSILKKELSPQIYQEFQEKYIKKYELKSQKENYVLYFLFLHQLLFQRRITSTMLSNVIEQIKHRIKKYSRGSQERMQSEPQRKEFHQKNMREFRKFEEIDLDFTRPRNYTQIKDWIKSLYLKKKAVYFEAQRKVRSIIKEHPQIQKIFMDELEVSEGSGSSYQANVKYEQSQNSDQSMSE